MILTVPGPATLAEYVNSQEKQWVKRPKRCAGCAGMRMWRHTGYERVAREVDGEARRIKIERFRCALCGLVVSCLFEFLIPYAQYTVQAVAQWAAAYLEYLTTYEAFGWSGAGDQKSSVFRRVDATVRKTTDLIDEVQTEAMLSRPEHVSMNRLSAECPNAVKAKSAAKAAALNSSATLLQICRNLVDKDKGADLLEMLHGYFATSAERLYSIFSCRKWLQMSNQHSLKRVIF